MYLFKVGLSFSLILLVVADSGGENYASSDEEIWMKMEKVLRNYKVGDKIEFDDTVIQQIMEGMNSKELQEMMGLDESFLNIVSEAFKREGDDAFFSYLESRGVTEGKLFDINAHMSERQEKQLERMAVDLNVMLLRFISHVATNDGCIADGSELIVQAQISLQSAKSLMRSVEDERPTVVTAKWLDQMEQSRNLVNDAIDNLHDVERLQKGLPEMKTIYEELIAETEKVVAEMKDQDWKWPAHDDQVLMQFAESAKRSRFLLKVEKFFEEAKKKGKRQEALVEEMVPRAKITPMKEEL